MGDFSREIDLEKLVSYSDDLCEVLRDKKDINNLTCCLQYFQALQSSCDSDFAEVQKLLEDYQRKTEECDGKTEEAISEAVADEEMDRLHKELEEEFEKERMVMENLRFYTSEFNDLDVQRISIEERMKVLKKYEQYKQREKMTLSMYASVTNIIPDLDDDSKIKGYIVDRKKKVVDKFGFDLAETTPYEAGANIWNMLNSMNIGYYNFQI